MKLYSTTTSERASKGQGGNEYIEIELKAFDRNKPVGIILLEVLKDSKDKPKQYIIQFKDPDFDEEWEILKEGHEEEGTIQTIIKGEKQKGDCEGCYDCEAPTGYACGTTPEA
mgnify:CR=1 FL=1